MSDENHQDGRVKFLFKQVSQAFRNFTVEKLTEFWKGENVERIVGDFLNNPETQAIFFKEGKSCIEILETPEYAGKQQLFYVIKLKKTQISESKIGQEVIYGDILTNPLEHMASLAQRVFHPIVGSKEVGQMWSETVAKEVKDYFESFVANVQITQGHVQGKTCLPLPNAGAAKDDVLDELGSDNADSDQFRQIHALEGALITWTKQIKNVLKQDPESLFVTFENPSPMKEIEFWRAKANNLNSIFDQLQSAKVRRVLKVLDRSKSTYNAPFAKLCKEVFHARAEANNINKYLRPLISWLEGLENEIEFENLSNHFTPIIHLLLMVWKSSAYYNTTSRLVIMIREICNTLIRQASIFLNGDEIFELIDSGDTQAAVKMLKTVLRIFGKFKSIYFEYKVKASVDCPDNPWTAQNNAVFIRLDSFLERCHDILDFGQTILMFTKLAKIEIGGTKGKTLTTSIAQIYSDFMQAVDDIRTVGKGILDLGNKAFEDGFYDFRNRIKELDRRLSSVILQGFDDANTVAGRFKLLDSFDSLLTRLIIADALEKKHASLIEAILADLLQVQALFNRYSVNPLVASNLPPIAGALTWSKSLRDRIQGPMEKLRTLDKKILERDDTRDCIKLYTTLIGQLGDLDKANIEAWGETIEDSSQTKLKNPLLQRRLLDPNDKHSVSLLHVNFDSVLVKLLREVKYFLLLGLEVPTIAMEIYQRVEIFRRQTGNLDLIVNMYNDLQTTLLPVERPLVKSQLDRIDKTLAQGVGETKSKGGVKALNWKSNGIEVFIEETMTEVREVSEMLQMLKGNLKSVEQTVSLWQTLPIFERSYKTASTLDFINLQKKTRQQKLGTIKEAGQELHRLLKDTNKRLKVSQGLPDWKAYVDFVNSVVVFGLSSAMAASLKAMATQFSTLHLEENNLPPLIEIIIDLVDNGVRFIPEVGFVAGEDGLAAAGDGAAPAIVEGKHHANAAAAIAAAPRVVHTNAGIPNMVGGLVNGMLGLASSFKRLDGTEGSYLREISESPDVLIQKTRVSKFLRQFETNANILRAHFSKYEYLWNTDMHSIFKEFLDEVVQIENVPLEKNQNNAGPSETAVTGAAVATGAAAAAAAGTAAASNEGEEVLHGYWQKTNINLEKFNEKIKTFLEIQVEVTDIKTIHEIDFVRVNAQPVKQAISTWVTKWLYLHTQYLQNYVGERLNDLHAFLQVVNKGLDVQVEAGYRESLMAVMTHIHNVRKRRPEILSLFDPMNAIVMLLKTNGIAIDLQPIGGHSALDFLEHSKMLWDNTVNKTFRVKETIQPLQSSNLEGVRSDVKTFQNEVTKFVKQFRQNGPFIWLEGTKVRDIYINIDNCQRQLLRLTSKPNPLMTWRIFSSYLSHSMEQLQK